MQLAQQAYDLIEMHAMELDQQTDDFERNLRDSGVLDGSEGYLQVGDSRQVLGFRVSDHGRKGLKVQGRKRICGFHDISVSNQNQPQVWTSGLHTAKALSTGKSSFCTSGCAGVHMLTKLHAHLPCTSRLHPAPQGYAALDAGLVSPPALMNSGVQRVRAPPKAADADWGGLLSSGLPTPASTPEPVNLPPPSNGTGLKRNASVLSNKVWRVCGRGCFLLIFQFSMHACAGSADG